MQLASAQIENLLTTYKEVPLNSRTFYKHGALLFLVSPALIISCSSGEPDGQSPGGSVGTGGVVNGGGGLPGVGDGDGDAVGSGGFSAESGGAPNGSGGGMSGGTGGAVPGSGGAVVSNCSNNLPTGTDWPEADCQMWADSGNCDQQWFIDQGACEESCGRCTAGSGGMAGDGDAGGGASGSGGTSGMGNPWGPVNGNEQGWTSRYWDCCKQSCGWSGKGGNSPVKSCDANGANVVSQDDASACDNGGTSTTCNSYSPWAYSDEVALGFVATHAGDGETCGTCYHIEFTGSSHNGGNDPGSQALAGKTMIVMATNIGGDVSGDGQLDLLVPGGGTGAMYGCDVAWGVPESGREATLGPNYGGFRAACGGGDHNAIKTCVANKCQEVFGSRGLTDMYEGCMWYATWFEAADNPNFKVEPIECPSELTGVAK